MVSEVNKSECIFIVMWNPFRACRRICKWRSRNWLSAIAAGAAIICRILYRVRTPFRQNRSHRSVILRHVLCFMRHMRYGGPLDAVEWICVLGWWTGVIFHACRYERPPMPFMTNGKTGCVRGVGFGMPKSGVFDRVAAGGVEGIELWMHRRAVALTTVWPYKV